MVAGPAEAITLINGGFASPNIATSNSGNPDPNYPTALLGNVFSSGHNRNTPAAYEGTQYAELNGTQNSSLTVIFTRDFTAFCFSRRPQRRIRSASKMV